MSSVDLTSLTAQPIEMLRKTEALIKKGYHRALLAFHGLEEHFEGKSDAEGSLLNRLTRHERRARLIEVRQVVNAALVESATADEAAARILAGIGAGLQWEFGALWKLDSAGTGRLRCAVAWRAPFAVELKDFEAETMKRRFRKNVGLVGRVWDKRKPMWIRDLSRAREFPRTRAAAANGLRTALAFPIFVPAEPGARGREEKLFGVMEFFSRQPHFPDDELLGLTGTLGDRIGQFMLRLRALEMMAELEKRLGKTVPELLVAAARRRKKPQSVSRRRGN